MILLSIMTLLVIAVVFLVWQKVSFDRWLEDGRHRITSAEAIERRLDLNTLPPLLQEYLEKVGVRDHSSTCGSVYFEQAGLFRMNPEDQMTSFTANQTVSLSAPMFSWEASIRTRGLPVKVCDRLIEGRGELEARLLGFLKVAKASGPELLRGELLRYLAEIPWYPSAIFNQPNIQWQQTGGSKLQGSLSVADVSATVEYRFEDGLIKSIYVPDRGRTVGSESIPTPWLGEFSEYKKVEGIVVPMRGEVSWLLPEAKFTYFKGEIVSYSLSCE